MSAEKSDTSGMVDSALSISAWLTNLDREIKVALEDGDEEKALRLMRERYGLEEEERLAS
jgi:hypothetical protein